MRLQGNNPMNDPDSKNSAHHSLFKPNRSELTSLLFSKNTPFYGTEVVPGDKADLRSSHQIDSMAIKTPVLSPVKMYKDFFFVPVNSILPENCDLLVTNPLSGDDIIPNDVNAGVFHADVRTLIEDWRAEHNGVLTAINSASTVPEESKLLIKALVHCFTVPVYLCSGGSVLQRLSNHLDYFRRTMEEGHGQGKKLGFIAQEMGREINTTGSKSNQAEMQNIVVRMKDELEQIKEQVLNVM